VTFGRFLVNGDETATAVLTALSATTILLGLILATTLPQFGRMMEGRHDD
jgi:hypothetical protein